MLTISPDSSSVDHELAEHSRAASSHFDAKIEHLETYSKIIEHAASRMDACVKDMGNVYETYDQLCNDTNDTVTSQATSTMSVYDPEPTSGDSHTSATIEESSTVDVKVNKKKRYSIQREKGSCRLESFFYWGHVDLVDNKIKRQL